MSLRPAAEVAREWLDAQFRTMPSVLRDEDHAALTALVERVRAEALREAAEVVDYARGLVKLDEIAASDPKVAALQRPAPDPTPNGPGDVGDYGPIDEGDQDDDDFLDEAL